MAAVQYAFNRCFSNTGAGIRNGVIHWPPFILPPPSPLFPPPSPCTQDVQSPVESPDGALPSSTPPPSDVVAAHPSEVMITSQPPSPASVESPYPKESVGALQKRVATLQEALDQAEEQRELINSEYRRLLGEKEVYSWEGGGGGLLHRIASRNTGSEH